MCACTWMWRVCVCVLLDGWMICHLSRFKEVPKRQWGSWNRQVKGTPVRKGRRLLVFGEVVESLLESGGVRAILPLISWRRTVSFGISNRLLSGITIFLLEGFILSLKLAARTLIPVRNWPPLGEGGARPGSWLQRYLPAGSVLCRRLVNT